MAEREKLDAQKKSDAQRTNYRKSCIKKRVHLFQTKIARRK